MCAIGARAVVRIDVSDDVARDVIVISLMGDAEPIGRLGMERVGARAHVELVDPRRIPAVVAVGHDENHLGRARGEE